MNSEMRDVVQETLDAFDARVILGITFTNGRWRWDRPMPASAVDQRAILKQVRAAGWCAEIVRQGAPDEHDSYFALILLDPKMPPQGLGRRLLRGWSELLR